MHTHASKPYTNPSKKIVKEIKYLLPTDQAKYNLF